MPPPWGRVGTSDEAGQSLVEFALVLPVLLLLIMGLVEFSFAFNARDSVFFAARDGSMLAAEGGNLPGTDCVVLDRIERDIVSPARPVRVQTVTIYWSDRNGAELSGAENLYTRAGTTTCSYGDGTSLTVPYALTTGLYLEGNRCDVLAGCGAGHPGPDNIGVVITYTHSWLTSVAQISLGSLRFNISAATRIEPQQ
ncbi:MAG TPA: TadE/TadG family type IV pilus assembly protein [Candidatus Limnocylindria bacterium]|nr:TadE/TadG family type IV pilus assembly protein [Candidatus Limnocylindria bacterium]